MASALPTVIRDPAEQTNTLLIASDGPLSTDRLANAARTRLHGNLARLGEIDAARITPRLEGGSVFTDDRAPVEWMIDRSIIGAAENHGR
jgi:hypothetical protein